MTLAERVVRVLVDVAEEPAISEDPDLQLFEENVLDSLRTVELIVAFSVEFGVEISPTELDRGLWATPRRIVEFIEARVRR